MPRIYGASAETVRYAYFGDRVVAEYGDDGLSDAEYVYGNYVDEVLHMRRDTDGDGTLDGQYWYHHDDQFNVVKVTTPGGVVVEQYDYGDYGQPEIRDGAGNLLAQSAIGGGHRFISADRVHVRRSGAAACFGWLRFKTLIMPVHSTPQSSARQNGPAH